MTELGRRVLMGLALLAIVLLAYVAWPFAEALLLAGMLASALFPLFRRFSKRLKGRRVLAGVLFVLGVVVTLVLPVVGVILAVAQQADDAFQPLKATFQEKGLNGLVDGLPQPLPGYAREVIKRLPRGEKQVEELVKAGTGRVLGAAGYLFLAGGSILFQTVMMLVALFFLLVDGPALIQWIEDVSPLTDTQTRALLSDFRDVSVAALAGSVGTALAQTAVALIGYWLAGASPYLLWSAATFIGAFIPVIGAGAIVVAASLMLLLTGHSGAALFLVIWGVAVVGTIDNFVKPYLMRGRMEINTGVILFALLGGVAVFGPIGILAGPLVISFFLAVVRMCQKELQTVK